MKRLHAGLALWVLALAHTVMGAPLTNGTFSSGLTGWAASGNVTDGGGFAVLGENPVIILTSLEQQFTLPPGAVSLSFEFSLTAAPGGPGGSMIPDAFSASLLDPVTFNPLLSTPGFTDFFYADNLGVTSFDPALVTISGNKVTLDISSLAAGTNALLVFDLIGGDDGMLTQVQIDNVQIAANGGPGPNGVPLPAALWAGLALIPAVRAAARRRVA